jgi:hypothetical protein
VDQAVQNLLCKHEGLHSNPSSTQKNKKKKKKELNGLVFAKLLKWNLAY